MMNVHTYLELRQQRKASMPVYRELCLQCLQPAQWCYCSQVKPFDCKITFVILLHFLELRKRIASGRMAHNILENSKIILGHTYSDNPTVNKLLEIPKYYPVILHLDDTATNISHFTEVEKKEFCPPDKELLVFVVDGKWSTASKTVRRSNNLCTLPKISFTPQAPSDFEVRPQPHKNCYSTIEAIHATIDILGESQGFDTSSRRHDHLLEVFRGFVSAQKNFTQALKNSPEGLNYRNVAKKYRRSCKKI